MKIRVLEPEDFPLAALTRLAEVGEVETGPLGKDPDPAVRAIFVRLAQRLGPHVHEIYPNLRWIVSPTTGLDHLDLTHFADHGIDVISLKGRTKFLDYIHATAEHTLALALALYRDVPGADRAVRSGTWNRYAHKGRELHGKTVLILGYGRIGRLVAPLYRAFGCHVLAHDTVADRVPPDVATDFPTVLGQIDVLSIHVPLNPCTVELVGPALIDRLPARAVVINTSRGEVVDQVHLLACLERGSLAGAALDVLRGEPAPVTAELASRLDALGRRLIITPHIGGFTYESLAQVEAHMVEVFLEAVRASR